MVAASPVRLCAFADLRNGYMYMLLRDSHVRVLMYLPKKDRYTENDIKYYFGQMGF